MTARAANSQASPADRGGGVIRWLAATAATLTLTGPQPARIAHISQHVFGSRWRTAACIAHYESTDGAHLYNGSNRGIFQINVRYHPWVDRRRVVSDWWYAARVAYRISDGGRHWRAWPRTSRLCGAPL